MVKTEKTFVGNVIQYAEWVKENANDIFTQCGWGEINGIWHKIDVSTDFGGEVGRLSIQHDETCVTEFFCEIDNHGIPLASVLNAIFAIKASVQTGQLKACNEVKRRWVVVAPSIDEHLICAIQQERIPISFLQANPEKDGSKYWQTKITAMWEWAFPTLHKKRSKKE